ncbi:MAG TPA: hypothetical protein VF230_19210 [Acidimicrobiales bacterium]
MRALAREVPFTDAADLSRWVQCVAWRLAIDDHRKLALVHDETTPEPATTTEVVDEVEHRLRWDATRRAWPRLAAADREAILTDSEPATRKEAVRVAVRRHRARARLLAMVEAAMAALVFAWQKGKRATPLALAAAAVPFVLNVAPFRADAPAVARDNATRTVDASGWFDHRASVVEPAAPDTARPTGSPSEPAAAPAVPVAPPSGRAVVVAAPKPLPPGEVRIEEREPFEPEPAACVSQSGMAVCGPTVNAPWPGDVVPVPLPVRR